MAGEVWTLNHPRLGRFEAVVAWRDELREIDPEFPSEESVLSSATDGTADDDHDAPADSVSDQVDAPVAKAAERAHRITERAERTLGVERTEQLRTWLNRDDQWSSRGLILTRNGVVIARLKSLKNARFRLLKSMPPRQLTTDLTTRAPERITVDVAAAGRFVTGIHVKVGDEVVAFDPPAGSPGAQRQAAMDASPWKRVAYPILGGLGKVGWAIWVLVMGPIIGKLLEPIINFLAWVLTPIVEWIARHIPDITIPWPDIRWPQIPLPDIHLPAIPWPSWTPPAWLAWLIEHPKLWTPLVAAVFFGLVAVRNNKKSQAAKAAWNEAEKKKLLAQLAGDLQTLTDKRRT